MIKRTLTYILVALVFCSCSASRQLEKAEKLYEEGGYHKSITYYNSAIKRLPESKRTEDVYFHFAEALRQLGRNIEAAARYRLAISKAPRTARTNQETTLPLANLKNPEIYLHYGQVLLGSEEYSAAKEQFLAYKALMPNDQQADMGLIACELAINPRLDTIGYIVENMNVINFNTNEYAPAFGTDDYETLYFTSTQKNGNIASKKYDVTGELTSDLFLTQLSREGKWGRAKPVIDLNTKGEDGAGVFNSSYTQFYFTRCAKVKREKIGCKIYTANVSGGEWGDVNPLNIVADSITAAHPAISHDGLTLYFVSDLPGGMGGMDIWYVTRANDEDDWGEIINMGPQINTKGNEMYPFMRADGTLYFSSNGHPGFGGLDIFKATPDSLAGYGWIVENMGVPFNSPSDDFGLIIERDNNRGYFSSRRKGGRGGDDIYSFALDVKPIEFYFEAFVKDSKTGRPLSDAEIRLVGSNGAILRKRSESNGIVRIRIHSGIEYLAIASRKDYLNDKVRFDTKGWKESQVHRDTLALVSTDKPIEIPNIFFDFNQASLREDSYTALEMLVTIMRDDNPNIVIELWAHTDNRGSNEINMDLSQRRAQAVVDYLISNGIDEERLKPIGFGASQPKIVDDQISKQYPFLGIGNKLDERFINRLQSEEQREICHQLNRRTEMKVTRSNYIVE